jgi:hypothetical protein
MNRFEEQIAKDVVPSRREVSQVGLLIVAALILGAAFLALANWDSVKRIMPRPVDPAGTSSR